MDAKLLELPWIKLGIQRGLFSVDREAGSITYVAVGKSYTLSHPEEQVRSRVYLDLIDSYQYPPSRIDLEVYAPRREPKLPADMVVYRDDEKENVYLVVETKAGSSSTEIEVAKREGLGNANLLNADLLLVAADEEIMIYDVSGHPASTKSLENHRLSDLPVRYGNVPKYRLHKGSAHNDLRKSSYNELDTKFQTCHEYIWDGGKRDPSVAFDEFSKVISSKLFDERFTLGGEPYKFQIGTNEGHKDVADRVRQLYSDVTESNPEVFSQSIDLPNSILYQLVQNLQPVSLRNTDLDAKGRAFENFLGKHFRGEYGQYFTPRQIVEFMVEVAAPGERDRVIDPACGSGGFLLYSMKYVMEAVRKKYYEDAETVTRLSWEFAHKQIFGIEINERIARVAMMDMVIHDDGHSNIECNDALDDFESFDPAKGINRNRFDVLLTNPPFGKKLTKEEKKYFPKYSLALTKNKKPKKSQMSEILFIERCLELVKDEGFVGIVLPDSAFTNKGNMNVIEFLLKRTQILSIVSLPELTFHPYGAQLKTSILFLRKMNSRADSSDSPIFMAHVEHVGYDATNRSDGNDLPDVLKEWKTFSSNPTMYPAFKQVKENLWIAKVKHSQLKNKLDVEAYSKDYLDVVRAIQSSVSDSSGVYELSDVSLKIFPGIGPKKAEYADAGIPIVKTATISKITENYGYINWNKVEFVDEQRFGQSPKVLFENDVLIQSVAHSKKYIADKVARVDIKLDGYARVLALSKFIIVRPDPERIDPVYLYIYLTSEFARIQYNHFIRGMTAEIYGFDLEHLLVVVPSRAKQERIVERYRQLVHDFHELQRRAADTKATLDEIGNDLLKPQEL